MSDINRMLPVGKPVEIAGRTFYIKPFSILEISQLQGWIKRTYPNPLDSLRGHLDGLTPEERAKLLVDAQAKLAVNFPPLLGTIEAETHLHGIEGMQEIARMMLRKADKSLTDEDVYELINNISATTFFKVMEEIMAVAMGEDEVPKGEGGETATAS
jgi:hypothetical protein